MRRVRLSSRGTARANLPARSLETQNFFLMHLSLFREYLDLEFFSLKTSIPALRFEYDLERIIDDFILLNIFVGNDFLPHLPGLHINEGALGRLFEIYKRILPVAGESCAWREAGRKLTRDDQAAISTSTESSTSSDCSSS